MKLPRFRKRWLLVFVVLVLVLGLIAAQSIRSARDEAFAMTCANNLQQIALGLHNYHSTNQQLPRHCRTDQTERPIHSWRPELVGYLEAVPHLYHWDEPWDSPKNRGFALNVPTWFENPEGKESEEELSNSSEFIGKDFWLRLKSGWRPPLDYGRCYRCPCQSHRNSFVVDYVAVTGELTAWPDSRSISFDDITDAHDTTILLVEINHSDILWSEPRDLRFDMMHFEINSDRGPSISSPHPAGPTVAFVDGSVARLSETIPPEVVKAMLTISGGENLDREEMRRKGWLR